MATQTSPSAAGQTYPNPQQLFDAIVVPSGREPFGGGPCFSLRGFVFAQVDANWRRATRFSAASRSAHVLFPARRSVQTARDAPNRRPAARAAGRRPEQGAPKQGASHFGDGPVQRVRPRWRPGGRMLLAVATERGIHRYPLLVVLRGSGRQRRGADDQLQLRLRLPLRRTEQLRRALRSSVNGP